MNFGAASGFDRASVVPTAVVMLAASPVCPPAAGLRGPGPARFCGDGRPPGARQDGDGLDGEGAAERGSSRGRRCGTDRVRCNRAADAVDLDPRSAASRRCQPCLGSPHVATYRRALSRLRPAGSGMGTASTSRRSRSTSAALGDVPGRACFPHRDVGGNVAYGAPAGRGRGARCRVAGTCSTLVAHAAGFAVVSAVRSRHRPAWRAPRGSRWVCALAPQPCLLLLDEPPSAGPALT